MNARAFNEKLNQMEAEIMSDEEIAASIREVSAPMTFKQRMQAAQREAQALATFFEKGNAAAQKHLMVIDALMREIE